MKIIYLSKKSFEKLKPLNLSCDVMNSEGELYEFHYKGQDKILKKLKPITKQG